MAVWLEWPGAGIWTGADGPWAHELKTIKTTVGAIRRILSKRLKWQRVTSSIDGCNGFAPSSVPAAWEIDQQKGVTSLLLGSGQ